MSLTLGSLDQMLLDEADKIEDLLAYHRNQVICPVYTSVDIRRNPCKAAVVDANAFPAGFNNLARRSLATGSAAIASYMERMYPGSGDVLILGESHSRNPWYFQNLFALKRLFGGAGFDVRLGTLNEELWPQSTMETALGDEITLHGVLRDGDELIADGIVADVVILNNDLSSGTPEILDGLTQPVTPPPEMGWHRRRKSEHFRIVADLARQLGAYVGFDPWCISAEFEPVSGVDFKAREGLDQVAGAVDRVIVAISAKYSEHGVDDEPHVFIKADRGTYGMGVMTAHSGEEFLRLNARQRQKMDIGKERQKTSTVIVQEGVPTSIRSQERGDAVAEPVMYMVCGNVVGGFNRLHAGKGVRENLNAPGSEFQPLCFGPYAGEPGPDETVLDETSAHIYQVIGEIASIATGYELRFMDKPGAALPSYP